MDHVKNEASSEGTWSVGTDKPQAMGTPNGGPGNETPEPELTNGVNSGQETTGVTVDPFGSSGPILMYGGSISLAFLTANAANAAAHAASAASVAAHAANGAAAAAAYAVDIAKSAAKVASHASASASAAATAANIAASSAAAKEMPQTTIRRPRRSVAKRGGSSSGPAASRAG